MKHQRSWPTPVARVADGLIEAAVVPSFSRLGPVLRSALFQWEEPPSDVLAGRRALVTGATSGIGASLAGGLAALGAAVHIVGRDPGKLEAAVRQVRSAAPDAEVVPELADLGRLDDVGSLAARLNRGGQLDLLAHVAGALVHEEQRTPDGLELTVQVHVVAPFLLTEMLLPLLEASPDGRVLTMSSGGMYTQRLDVDDLLHPSDPFDGTVVYARAKRAQVELNAAWARRHPDLGIGFHAMHPGWVDTPGLRAGLPAFAHRLRPILRTVDQGADTALWLAWTDEAPAPGGDFWLDRRRRHTVALPWTRTPDGEVDRMWWAITRAAGLPAGRTLS